MVPNLARLALEFIRDMISSNYLTHSQITNAAGCHPSTITRHITNNMFRNMKVPPNKGGCPRRLIPIMIKALCDHLLKKPHLLFDKIAIFLLDEFQVQGTTCSISCTLMREGQSKKAAKYKARERNVYLRGVYSYFMSDICSQYLVYMDESGRDKRVGFRRTCWSSHGIAPTQAA